MFIIVSIEAMIGLFTKNFNLSCLVGCLFYPATTLRVTIIPYVWVFHFIKALARNLRYEYPIYV